MQNHQSTVKELLDYCKTLYGSIGQNEHMRVYSNLNSICLSSCGSLQQYIIRFNNAHEELRHIGSTTDYGLIVFWFIEYLDDDEYRFWKESFKTKIQELSDKTLEDENWIRQAQQELLDRNIDPTGEGKPSLKRQYEDSIGEVNMTAKSTSRTNPNRNKRSKSTNSDSNSNSAKSQQAPTRNKSVSNTTKCKICDGNHPMEDCYYTAKNPPAWWSGKPEIWRRLIKTQSKQE